MTDILTISDRRDNAELIADAAKLGYIRGNVLDLSYGEGTFWKDHQPDSLTTNDIDPLKGDHHQDFRATLWPSRFFDTVIFDPPYKLGGTPASPDMDARYGTSQAMTRNEVLCLLVGGVAEGARLSDDLLIVKAMDQVNGGRVRWQTDVATEVARACEFRKIDVLILPGGRKQPAGTKQQHARHEYSTLLIFGRK
jgi:hypothetical protein